jgi:hypothetical protein
MADSVIADTLVILDTCAPLDLDTLSGGGRDVSRRKFERLCACRNDSTTATPGPHSFTRALIDALAEFCIHIEPPVKPFSTYMLNIRIQRNPSRHDTPSVLWSRQQDVHSIRLPQIQARQVQTRTPKLPSRVEENDPARITPPDLSPNSFYDIFSDTRSGWSSPLLEDEQSYLQRKHDQKKTTARIAYLFCMLSDLRTIYQTNIKSASYKEDTRQVTKEVFIRP